MEVNGASVTRLRVSGETRTKEKETKRKVQEAHIDTEPHTCIHASIPQKYKLEGKACPDKSIFKQKHPKMSLSSFCVSYLLLTALKNGQYSQWCSVGKTNFSFARLSDNFWVRNVGFYPLPLLGAGIVVWLEHVQILCVLSHILWIPMSISLVVGCNVSLKSSTSGSWNLPTYSSVQIPDLEGGGLTKTI